MAANMKLVLGSLLLLASAHGAPQVLSEIDTYDDLLAIESQFIENEISPVQKILPPPQGFNGERFSAPPLKFTSEFSPAPAPPRRNNFPSAPQPPRRNNFPSAPQPPRRNNFPSAPQPPRRNNFPSAPQPPRRNNFPSAPQPPRRNNFPSAPQPPRRNNVPSVPQPPRINNFNPRPAPQPSAPQPASISDLQINPNDPHSYSFSFETPEMKRDEAGQPKGSDSYVKTGGWEYVGDDGRVYSVRFIADENGFRPVGNHLPTPPPLPPALQRFEDARNGRLSRRQG